MRNPLDLLEALGEETFVHAPGAFRNRLYELVSPQIAGDALLHFARVRLQATNFELDPDGGRWAFVVPIFGGRSLRNWAAFCVEQTDLRRTYYPGEVGVGFEEALNDARWDEARRILVHDSPWTWLRNECTGCVPLDWQAVAHAIQRERLCVLAHNELEARRIKTRIEPALKPPRVLVRRPASAKYAR